MVRSGVPIHFRPLVWQCLAKVETSTAKQKYAEYLKMNSPCEKVIRRDISRTYPEHEFFKEKHGVGQERLFNVIKVRAGREYFIIDYIDRSRLIHCSIVKWAIVKALVSLWAFS
jgi:fructose-1,6-bisphosphatase/inositol monophosphatase family enzyme